MSRRWLGPVLIGLMLVATILVYPRLPHEVPTHWDASGRATGFMAKPWGAFLLPLAAGGVWLLVVGLRRVDPRREHYALFEETFWLALNLITALMLVFQALVILAGLGFGFDMGRAIAAVVGVMLLALGNYLPRLRSNWWMGIRTPWTLESETVWRKTHRFGGRLLVVAGLVTLATLPLPDRMRVPVLPVSVAVMALASVIYSYVVWRGVKGGE